MGKFTGKEKPGFLDGLVTEETTNPTYKHTHTSTHTPTQKTLETKSRRVNLLLKPSTVARLDEYIETQKEKDIRTSKNDIIQTLLDKFLDENL